MSSPDPAQFGELMAELRAARPATPTALRAHVLELREPAARSRRSFRRPAFVLAPAALAATVAAAVVIGVVQSGGEQPLVQRGPSQPESATLKGAAAPSRTAKQDAALPGTASRAQRYEAELTLRVHDLSAQTKRALRLTRALGGYVRSVDYGQGADAGSAELVVRVPVERVQQAIVRFSALGDILAQHVRIQDLQPGIDRRFRQMQALRRQIAALEREGTPDATAQAALLRRRLVALQREQAQELRRASFATVSLSLRTKEAEAAAPASPGRIERAFDRAGAILVEELAIVIYVFMVALPLVLLAAAAIVGSRSLRRRSTDRLLEQS